MAVSASVLVAHGSDGERARIGSALHEAGCDVVYAADGVEALRSTAGINPKLVVAHVELPDISALEVVSRLQGTGLSLPPFLILYDDPAQVPDEVPDGMVRLVPTHDLETDGLVDRVRLMLLAGEVQGEFGVRLDVMYGDLARTSFGDLLMALHRGVISGRLVFTTSHDACVWLKDGAVIDAVFGPVRGVKAFNRLAGLPSGGFSLQLEDPDADRVIEEELDHLVTDAVEERLTFAETLNRLPSLDSRPGVQLDDRFFNHEFSPVEREIVTAAQEVTTFGDLIDRVAEADGRVLQAVAGLLDQGLLTLEEPAGRIHVVTDSTADMLSSDARRAGITVVPVSIVFGSKVFMDGVDLQPDDFHRLLGESDDLPVTNPATRGEFQETYRRIVTSGNVLSVLCSSELSKSYENACSAADEAMEELRELRRAAKVSAEPVLEAVDSRQASAPLGMLAVFAARLVRTGCPLPEAKRRIADIGRRFRTVLMVSTLDYLRHSGGVDPASVPKAKGRDTRWLLDLLDGALKVSETLHGGPQALRRLFDRVVDGVDVTRPVFAALVHASAPAGAAELRPLLTRNLRIVELTECQMGPAVTCHVGPGTVGAAVFQPTDEELELLSP